MSKKSIYLYGELLDKLMKKQEPCIWDKLPPLKLILILLYKCKFAKIDIGVSPLLFVFFVEYILTKLRLFLYLFFEDDWDYTNDRATLRKEAIWSEASRFNTYLDSNTDLNSNNYQLFAFKLCREEKALCVFKLQKKPED